MAELCTENPFSTIIARSEWEEGKKNGSILQSHCFNTLVSWASETLRWRHKLNWTHSPVLASIGQKSAKLPCLLRVQHLKEKSRVKNFLAIINRAVAKVYLCDKKFGGWWHLNLWCDLKLARNFENFSRWNYFTRRLVLEQTQTTKWKIYFA